MVLSLSALGIGAVGAVMPQHGIPAKGNQLLLPPGLWKSSVVFAQTDFLYVLRRFRKAARAVQYVKYDQVVAIVAVGMANIGGVMPTMLFCTGDYPV